MSNSTQDPAAAALAAINIDQTLGALQIGLSCSCVAFGVLSMQCFSYFIRYPKDSLGNKFLVATIWGLEFFDQVLIAHSNYFYSISNFLTPLNILTHDIIWSFISQILLANVIGTTVKICFAMRVWRLSNRKLPITALIVGLTTIQSGLSLTYIVRAFQLNKLALASRLTLIASLSLGAGALTDITTAIALTYFLKKMRTGYRQSDTLINGLTRYAINTGGVTSILSIATLIAYAIKPSAFISSSFYFTLSKLYGISLICALNTRKLVGGRGTDRENSSSTGNAVNLNVYSGNAYYMASRNHAGGRSRATVTKTGDVSAMEIGVQQEVSVVTDGLGDDEEYDRKAAAIDLRKGLDKV